MEQERRHARANYLIPVLLHDMETGVYIKGIITDLSGSGCGVLTNDRRARMMDNKQLYGRTFQLEFDFYEYETRGVEGRIIAIHIGQDRDHEREFGIEFTKIPLLLKRDINRTVMRDLEEQKRKKPPASRDRGV